MSFRVVAKVLRHSEERLARRLILIVLGEAASDDGVAWIDQETIAHKARLARTHVTETIREMEEASVIEVRKAQRGRRRISVYRLLLPGLDAIDYDRLPFALTQPFTASEVPTPSIGDGVGTTGLTTSEPQGKAETRSSSSTEPSREPEESPPDVYIRDRWLRFAPPLISHRETYFTTAAAKAATKRSLRVYPALAVGEAIENYATCLGGSEYRWSYKWTFVDFLNRGLDKFVAEADPLRNFRSGRQTRSEDFDDLPEL